MPPRDHQEGLTQFTWKFREVLRPQRAAAGARRPRPPPTGGRSGSCHRGDADSWEVGVPQGWPRLLILSCHLLLLLLLLGSRCAPELSPLLSPMVPPLLLLAARGCRLPDKMLHRSRVQAGCHSLGCCRLLPQVAPAAGAAALPKPPRHAGCTAYDHRPSLASHGGSQGVNLSCGAAGRIWTPAVLQQAAAEGHAPWEATAPGPTHHT